MDVALGLLAVLFLIFANGAFVAAEFAYVAVPRGRMEEAAEAGDARGRRAVAVLKRLSFMLSGAQLGITVTSLLVGFIAEPTLGRALRPVVTALGVPETAAFGVSLTVGFALATATQMVLGELAPKNLAIARPEQFALVLSRPTVLYTRLASPFIRIFDESSNALLRAVGIQPVEELEGGVSADELGYIISESSRGGTLDEAQANLLSRALDFRSLRAVDAMVPRTNVDHIDVTATGGDLRRLALDTGHSRFPVVRDSLDDVVGVVQAQDLLRIPFDARDHTPIRGLLGPALAVPESTALGPLLADMRARHSQLAVVVDEYGGTAGIVTLEDIVEELVGNIQDEHDPAEPTIRREPDGSYVVPGSWRPDEIERETGLMLPEGDYDTVGGLVMERLERVPAAGDHVTVNGVTLTVLEMTGLAVASVRVHPAPEQP
ncbi:MAG TPA: hemolysin family protein [Egibacteraceae bacterium]|nr:hemolysin family protein [Egibacteraceae bacterium]